MLAMGQYVRADIKGLNEQSMQIQCRDVYTCNQLVHCNSASVQASPTLFQSNPASLQEVYQPPGRGYQQHTPHAHILHLATNASSSIYSTWSHTRAVGVLDGLRMNLGGQFPCGDKHQTLGELLLIAVRVEVILF